MPKNTVSSKEHPTVKAYLEAEKVITSELTALSAKLIQQTSLLEVTEIGQRLWSLQSQLFKLYTRYYNKLPSITQQDEKIAISESYLQSQQQIQQINTKIYELISPKATALITRAQFLKLPQPWQLYDSVQNLMLHLDSMETYAEQLGPLGNKKVLLTQQLKDLVTERFEFEEQTLKKMPKNQSEFNVFMRHFQTMLHSLDDEKSKHSTRWQNVEWQVKAANIAVAFTGLGALALLYRALHAVNSPQGANYKSVLFFAKTKEEEQVAEVDKDLEDISRYLPKG